jgi:hypothetical protein
MKLILILISLTLSCLSSGEAINSSISFIHGVENSANYTKFLIFNKTNFTRCANHPNSPIGMFFDEDFKLYFRSFATEIMCFLGLLLFFLFVSIYLYLQASEYR